MTTRSAVLLYAALAVAIGLLVTSCKTPDAGGEQPYPGPLVNDSGQVVTPPDWGTK